MSMSDIKLFKTEKNGVSELRGSAVALEKSLQSIIEQNMETFLGVRFLATEFTTSNRGRIDSLGIDENGSPVIIEYKRASNQNVINQGLFYLDWLMDHQADFKLLVREKFDEKTAKSIDWSAPRLICIAGNFTKYDTHAVNQMNRNIELVRYRRFDKEELLLFELLASASGRTDSNASATSGKKSAPQSKSRQQKRPMLQYIADSDQDLRDLYEALKAYLLALGDDVQIAPKQQYIAFRRLKNFADVVAIPRDKHFKVYVKIDPDSIKLEKDFTQDMRGKMTYTGQLQIRISDLASLEKAKPLLLQSYENS